MATYKFGGYATKSGVLCTDGRIIRPEAFAHQDGERVPLLFMHNHFNPDAGLGSAILENRPDGVYAHCEIDLDTKYGRQAATLVKNGHYDSLSINASGLEQEDSNVIHGDIKEVSLVTAGANPLAKILEHADSGTTEISSGLTLDAGDDYGEEDYDMDEYLYDKDGNVVGVLDDDENEEYDDDYEDYDDYDDDDYVYDSEGNVVGTMSELDDNYDDEYYDDDDSLSHSDDDLDIQNVVNSLSDDEREVFDAMVTGVLTHSVDSLSNFKTKNNTPINTVLEHMDDSTMSVLEYIVGSAEEDANDEEDNTTMKHNLFENDKQGSSVGLELSHADFTQILELSEQAGSFRKGCKEWAAKNYPNDNELNHAVNNLDILFPEAKMLNNEPELDARDQGWVTTLLSKVKKTPFSRIKTVDANVTEDEARAKGYIKGKEKKEEVFELLKRTTDPQTIYKKQALDRDDILDMSGFNFVAFLKREMKMMLKEEIARAITVGDGRTSLDPDKIKEDHVRPIWKEADKYAVKVKIEPKPDENYAEVFIDQAIRNRKLYKGSGNPIMLIKDELLSDLLLIKDKVGRRIYSLEDLKNLLRCRDIISCPVMDNQTRKVSEATHELLALYFNPIDYSIGCDKGGEITSFEHFDINFNKNIYLDETRISGALTKLYSALVFEKVTQSPGK